MEHLRRGLRKPFCAGGDGETSQLTKFVARSRVPHIEQVEALGGSIPIRTLLDNARAVAGSIAPGRAAGKSGDLQDALALQRQATRYADQFVAASRAATFDRIIASIRSDSYTLLETLVTKHPKLVSPAEMRRIKAAAAAADLDKKALLEADRRLYVDWRSPPAREPFMAGFAVAASASVILLLLLAGACTHACWRNVWASRAYRLMCRPVSAHVAVWFAGLAISFVVLGIFPAEIVPPAVQGWIILGSAVLFVTVTVGWIVWRIMVRRRFQYTIRTMLIVTFFWALFLGC